MYTHVLLSDNFEELREYSRLLYALATPSRLRETTRLDSLYLFPIYQLDERAPTTFCLVLDFGYQLQLNPLAEGSNDWYRVASTYTAEEGRILTTKVRGGEVATVNDIVPQAYKDVIVEYSVVEDFIVGSP